MSDFEERHRSVGSVDYAAPEMQDAEKTAYDEMVDVFSLGVTWSQNAFEECF